MEVPNNSPFDETQTVHISGNPVDEPPTVHISGNPTNGFTAPYVIGRSKSSGPKIFGIIAIMMAVISTLFNFYGLLSVESTLDNYEQIGIDVTMSINIWVYISSVVGIIYSIIFGYAGLQLYNYQKKSIFIGLAAVGISLASGIIGSVIMGDMTQNDEIGGILTGIGIFTNIICNVCCGLVILMPLLINGEDLE